jgi:hypothetical protein
MVNSSSELLLASLPAFWNVADEFLVFRSKHVQLNKTDVSYLRFVDLELANPPLLLVLYLLKFWSRCAILYSVVNVGHPEPLGPYVTYEFEYDGMLVMDFPCI